MLKGGRVLSPFERVMCQKNPLLFIAMNISFRGYTLTADIYLYCEL